MTESKSQDKFFPYGVKHEGLDNFNWAPLENDFDEFKNSNSFLLTKFNTKNQFFGDFNPLSMNPDLNNDPSSMMAQNENQNTMNDQTDPVARVNTSFPLFNDKLLANTGGNNEVGINSMKPPYSNLVMKGLNNLQTYPMQNNYYFPFSNNNIRRPLPQELLEEEPVYVNPKQYERIMKLRIKKAQRGMVKTSVMPLERPKDKSYKHLSRHLHAKKRERGAGGRFLSKEAQQRKNEEEAQQGLDDMAFANLTDPQNFEAIQKADGDDEQ